MAIKPKGTSELKLYLAYHYLRQVFFCFTLNPPIRYFSIFPYLSPHKKVCAVYVALF